MSLDLDEELLKIWPEFCTFALETLRSRVYDYEDSSSVDENSLFLNLMHNERLEMYEECGFGSKLTDKLDEVVKKTEQFCLQNFVNLYESFKQQTLLKHMSTCTINIKRFDEFLNIAGQTSKGKKNQASTGKSTAARTGSTSKISLRAEQELGRGKRKSASKTDSNKEQEFGRRKDESTPRADSETEQELPSSDPQELGRGKRKKIVKVKFEFSEDSPFRSRTKEAAVPPKALSTSKRDGHSETQRKTKEPVKTTTGRAMTNAKGKTERDSLSKDFVQEKSQINSAKTGNTGSEDVATSKGPASSNVGSFSMRKNLSSEEVVDLDMSVDLETQVTRETDSDHAACTSVIDVKTEGGMHRISAENCCGKDDKSELDKDSSLKPAGDGCCGEEESAPNPEAYGQKKPNGEVKVKKGRGPQKSPKKLPWKKVPMVCSKCKTRFAAYSTLRRHWARVHAPDRKFNFSNPPKLLLCTICEEKFSFPHQYLKHYRAHGVNVDSDKKNSVPDAKPDLETVDNEGGMTKSAANDHEHVNGTKDENQTEEAQESGAEQEGLGKVALAKEGETINNSVQEKTEELSASDASNRKVSVTVKSRKGRGPQKTPKKFPWSLVPIVCSMCKTRYSTYSTLRRHWTKMHSSNKEFDRLNPPKLMLCTVCDETFSWPRQFLKHYREHAAGQELALDRFRPVKFIGERTDFPCDKLVPITCSVCKKTINGEGVIYSHWKKEHRVEENQKPPPLFYCDKCEQTFDAPRKFKLHYRIHTGAKPHECEICQKTFRTFSDLTAHMLCHNQSKEFKCEICGKCFIAQKILNRHMKGHLFPCVCDICGKSYPSKYSLSLHKKIHTGEKPHKCEFCGVAFIQAGSLKLHRRLHLGDKPHVCETCGMRFNSMSHLRTHKRVHTGEKPYKCDKCNYAAASSSRLKDHATVHKDEKPHVCKVPGCGRRYKRLSHLIFHHSKHAGIKPYVCKTCGMAFKLSSALSLHKRQDACALRKEEQIKSEWTEDQPKEDIIDYNLLVSRREDATDKPEEIKEEHQTVYIYHDVREDPQEVGDASQQIIGLDGASHAELTLEGQENFEQQIVIQIVREPGQEDEDIVLSKEELERIVHLSQQM